MTAAAPGRHSRPSARRAFLRDETGASAVEFAMVAAPFLGLLIGIIQTFVVFFAGLQLEVIVNKTSRMILTGQAQDANMSQAAFAQALCKNIGVLFTCSKLMINVQAYSSFAAASTTAPTLTFNAQGQVTNTWNFVPGSPGQIVVVQVMYQWPVMLGPLGFNLSSLANGNRLLMATAAFKNEPYK